MASAIGKYAAKKLLKGEMAKYKGKSVEGDKDPYFALKTDPRTGKTKKVKKQVPDYIPEHDALVLAKVRKRAYSLDMCLFNLFGIRFGWSSVVGLVPAAGDAIDGLLAFRTIQLCQKVECGIPGQILLLMYFNLILDIVVGLVPFIGDLGDAAFKANTRNLRLLEKRLDDVYKPKAITAAEEKMRPEDRPQPATVYEDFGDSDDEGRRREYSGDGGVRQPTQARVPTERRGEVMSEKKGVFGGKKSRAPDVENGQAYVPSRSGTRDGPSRSGTRGSRR